MAPTKKVWWGPYNLKVVVKGPCMLSERQKLPNAWIYRAGGRVELHLQVKGKDGLMHYTIEIPAPRKLAAYNAPLTKKVARKEPK